MNKPVNSSYSIQFQLSITADKYLAFYQGTAQDVLVRSIDNRNIRFPANTLRPFLTHNGIFGLFEIYFDHNNKLIKLEKIDS